MSPRIVALGLAVGAALTVASQANARPIEITAAECETAITAADQPAPPTLGAHLGEHAHEWALREGAVCAARRSDFAAAEELFEALEEASPGLAKSSRSDLARSAAQSKEGAALALRVLAPLGPKEARSNPDRAAALLFLGRRDEIIPLLEASYKDGGLRFDPTLQLDRRFESVWKIDQSMWGSDRAAAEEVRSAFEEMTKMAGLLVEIGDFGLHFARLELLMGRPAVALGIDLSKLEASYARDGGISPDTFWNALAIHASALIAVGRLDEAVALVSPPEMDVIDAPEAQKAVRIVTMALVRADRPAEAQVLLDSVRPRYGNLPDPPLLRDCVATRLGKRPVDPPPYNPRPHTRERYADIGVILETLLCSGREDEAAKALIAALDNPDRRSSALLTVQRYRPWLPLGAFDQELYERREALLKRPDVAAAIEREGRILDLAIYRPD